MLELGKTYTITGNRMSNVEIEFLWIVENCGEIYIRENEFESEPALFVRYEAGSAELFQMQGS
jgi:hypothetical protein